MIRELRCYWCEVLIGWALKACPSDYVPSCVQMAIDAHEHGIRPGAYDRAKELVAMVEKAERR